MASGASNHGEELAWAAQGVVESWSLKVFKERLDVALRDTAYSSHRLIIELQNVLVA